MLNSVFFCSMYVENKLDKTMGVQKLYEVSSKHTDQHNYVILILGRSNFKMALQLFIA